MKITRKKIVNKNFQLYKEYKTLSPIGTMTLAQKIAGEFKNGDVVGFAGPLGSGKTCFIKGIVRKFGIKSKEVSSPTFVLLRIYKGKKNIYHFDLYRIKKYEELENIGYREYLTNADITLIEWADKVEEINKDFNWMININYISKKERKITIYKRMEKVCH